MRLDETQVLKTLVGLVSALRHSKLFAVSVAITKLTDDDLQELDEAIRLVKGFVNNS